MNKIFNFLDWPKTFQKDFIVELYIIKKMGKTLRGLDT